AILHAGLARVVVGAVDPNPHHAGRGLDLLRAGGLSVTQGILETECRELNRAFNKWIVSRIPWVIAKAGMSLDGRITRPPGEGQWLTSEASRADAMQLRSRVDAILVGANTLRADNPRLTLRGLEGFKGRQPWRVVVCSGKKPLPQEAHLFTDEHRDRTLIYAHAPMELPFAKVRQCDSLRTVLEDLGKRQVTSVLIEGGMRVLGEAFDQQLVDEVQFYMAPLLCGGPMAAVGGEGAGSTAESVQIREPKYHQIGNDLRLSGLAVYPGVG
ncbi:MAG: bifunctional diaminohydroxyphosphoribosylaminopyrimidine deaminase/5-amino-6-(5-phosphoribosylamino)uracil reductase RibD, partial [Verrucomicrobiaceae bacterium]